MSFINNKKYRAVLFCNKKKIKTLYGCQKWSTMEERWKEFKTQKQPRYVKLQGGAKKRKQKLNYELGLVVPNHWKAKPIYSKDELGRNTEILLENKKQRIKELIPYWEEETVYDFKTKLRLKYDELLNRFKQVDEIAQLFILNNRIYLQIDDYIEMYGNKNVNDSNRLLDLLREDLLKKEKTNFMFVKDVSMNQRINLYNFLVSKGYKKSDLRRHYSY